MTRSLTVVPLERSNVLVAAPRTPRRTLTVVERSERRVDVRGERVLPRVTFFPLMALPVYRLPDAIVSV